LVKELLLEKEEELKACSLNCAVTDGKTIVVSRFRNSLDVSTGLLATGLRNR
jgi:hypothetical protein